MLQIRHLHISTISFVRERDHVPSTFKTYCLSTNEWGFELMRANCENTSKLSDPDFYSGEETITAIHRLAERFE